MIIENISALRVDLYNWEYNESPHDIMKKVWPDNIVQSAWIPQTMGEQIWILLAFHNKAEKTEWECRLPGSVKQWLDESIIACAIPYGWKIRDINGFVREKKPKKKT